MLGLCSNVSRAWNRIIWYPRVQDQTGDPTSPWWLASATFGEMLIFLTRTLRGDLDISDLRPITAAGSVGYLMAHLIWWVRSTRTKINGPARDVSACSRDVGRVSGAFSGVTD